MRIAPLCLLVCALLTAGALPVDAQSLPQAIFDDFSYTEQHVYNGVDRGHCEPSLRSGSVFGSNRWWRTLTSSQVENPAWQASNWDDLCFTGDVLFVDSTGQRVSREDSETFMRVRLPEGLRKDGYRGVNVVSSFLMEEGTYLFRARFGSMEGFRPTPGPPIGRSGDPGQSGLPGQKMRLPLWTDSPDVYHFCDVRRADVQAAGPNSGSGWCMIRDNENNYVRNVNPNVFQPAADTVHLVWSEADYEFNNGKRFHHDDDPDENWLSSNSVCKNTDSSEGGGVRDWNARMVVGNPAGISYSWNPALHKIENHYATPTRLLQCASELGPVTDPCGDCLQQVSQPPPIGTGWRESESLITADASPDHDGRFWDVMIVVHNNRIEYGMYSTDATHLWAGGNAMSGEAQWAETVALDENTPMSPMSAIISAYWLNHKDAITPLRDDLIMDVDYFVHTPQTWASPITAANTIRRGVDILRRRNIYRLNSMGAEFHDTNSQSPFDVVIEGPENVQILNKTYRWTIGTAPALMSSFDMDWEYTRHYANGSESTTHVVGPSFTLSGECDFAGVTHITIRGYAFNIWEGNLADAEQYAEKTVTVSGGSLPGCSSQSRSRPGENTEVDGLEEAIDSASLEALPTASVIDAVYPNPFSKEANIRFGLPTSSEATLVVYDVWGREIARLIDEVVTPGWHEITWDASRLPSGVYVYRLTAGGHTDTRKAIVVR